MTTQASSQLPFQAAPNRVRGPLTRRWRRRFVLLALLYVTITALGPVLLGLSPVWRSFGAGLAIPGAGVLLAIPTAAHEAQVGLAFVHAIAILVEVAALAWAFRRFPVPAALGAVVAIAVTTWAAMAHPAVVITVGHVAILLGVVATAAWAYGVRLIAAADFVTLPVVVVASAVGGALLTAEHDMHGGVAAEQTWTSWAVWAAAVVASAALMSRSAVRNRAERALGQERAALLERRWQAGPARTGVVVLRSAAADPTEQEATAEQMRLLRYLLSVSAQPVDDWRHFDPELFLPLAKRRYQVNALGWSLAAFQYSFTPSYAGILQQAQVNLIERAQTKAVWGYWYWQNLLGNYDFRQRRSDPIGVPQNIMFSAYLNLQLGMYRQASGDTRFDEPDSLRFEWSPDDYHLYDRSTINNIVAGNFDRDICLWPCEPAPWGGGRRRGFVFPYCNAVALGSVAVADGIAGSARVDAIAQSFSSTLRNEFTRPNGDLTGFVVSGLGVSVGFTVSGLVTTALVAALVSPADPEFAWRAWQILQHEWLETGKFRVPRSAARENPDWGTNAITNAESLASAMLLARELGEHAWHDELWEAAIEQLDFGRSDGVDSQARFEAASVHANGMLGFAGFGRRPLLAAMSASPRPDGWQSGPRLTEAPHPEVLVAKAVSDGAGLDLVLRPGSGGGRFALAIDQLVPRRSYICHGTQETDVVSDDTGRARLTVDLSDRHEVQLRSAD